MTEKSRDKEARRFQKTRKTTAEMGGLCEERSEKGRGERANNMDQWKQITKVGVLRSGE